MLVIIYFTIDDVRATFSDWTLAKVLRFFSIVFIPTTLTDVKMVKLPAQLVEEIRADLDTVYQLRGPIRECNEKAREKFIDVVCLLKERKKSFLAFHV